MKREASDQVQELEEIVKNEENKEQKPSQKQEEQVDIRRIPKVRLALITGYNGLNYFGSQKNPDVNTIEEELEKNLLKVGWIAEYNYGDLKKIGWSRATRTDKRVHALQNVFSCKAHIQKNADYEQLRQTFNKTLPEDIRVFSVIEVSNRFNAKNFTSSREYSYFLPTFMLTDLHHLFLGTSKNQKQEDKQKEENGKEEEKKSENEGIKIIKREVNRNDSDYEEDDQYHNQDFYLNRNVDHISDEQFEMLYSHRLMDDEKERLVQLFKMFEGTQKYHNYTKEIKSHDMKCNRYMMELKCSEYVYINRDTFEVTKDTDLRSMEFVHFFLKGQSFLYNQIRKMIGGIIQVFRGDLEDKFIQNTLKDNVVNVALAPGDGLLLEKVCYDKYNSLTNNKKNDIMIQLVKQQEEINEFRNNIIKHIAKREIEGKAFTKWLSQFDDQCESYYIKRQS